MAAMVHIASRRSWGARYPDGNLTLRGLAAEVFLHHTVTAQLSASATVAQERAQMRIIEQIGYSRFGRHGIGISYNVVIFPSGRAYQGVSWNRRGAHTDGRNSTTRSICFAGNYEAHRPTAAVLATAAAIVAEGRGKWWVRGAPVRGHRDIKSTACPGRHVYAQRSYIASQGATPVINPVTPPRDWFDMATESDLRRIVREEVAAELNRNQRITVIHDRVKAYLDTKVHEARDRILAELPGRVWGFKRTADPNGVRGADVVDVAQSLDDIRKAATGKTAAETKHPAQRTSPTDF